MTLRIVLVILLLSLASVGFAQIPDAEKVKEWREAAARGEAWAQFNLGNMYLTGEGVLKNDAEAVKWYRKAAAQGNVPAQYNLGNMYSDGIGVPENDAEAVKWFRKAADQGLANAQYNLGVMYATGEGVAENYVLAHMWMKLARAQGNENAKNNLKILILKMTQEQIAEAQRLAAAWPLARGPIRASTRPGVSKEKGAPADVSASQGL